MAPVDADIGTAPRRSEEAVAAVKGLMEVVTAANKDSMAEGVPPSRAAIPFEASSGLLAYHFSDVSICQVSWSFVRLSTLLRLCSLPSVATSVDLGSRDYGGGTG